MHFAPTEITRPRDEGEFERMCQRVYGLVFNDHRPVHNGRRGQEQDGVDVFVEADDGRRIGIQCKKYTTTRLTVKHVKAEIAKTDKNKVPISLLLFATTASSDARLLRQVQDISDQRVASGLFPVGIDFWEDVVNRIENHQILQDSYAPNSPGAIFSRIEGRLEKLDGWQEKSIAIAMENPDRPVRVERSMSQSALPEGSDSSANKIITSLLDRSNELIKEFKYREALGRLEDIGQDMYLLDSHQKARWFLQRGVCLWLSRDDEKEAAGLFVKASETYPGDEKMAAAGIRGRMLSGDIDGAAEAARAALERFPVSLHVWLAVANARMLAGEPFDVEDIPASFRNEPDALQFAALSARNRGDISKAADLAEAAATNPAAGFFNKSIFLRFSAEACSCMPVQARHGILPEESVKRMMRAVSLLEPRSEKLWAVQSDAAAETAGYLGFALLMAGDAAKALDVSREAAGLGLGNADTTRVEMQALFELGRKDEALALARSSVKRLCRESLAVACEIASDKGDREFVDSAIAEVGIRFPEEPLLSDYLEGLLWAASVRAGKKNEAIAAALERAPLTRDRIVIQCAAARLLRWAGRPIEAEDAAEAIRALVSSGLDTPEAMMAADVLCLFEKWKDAAALYETLLKGAGRGPSQIHARLLECLAESGLRAKARTLLESLPDGWAEDDGMRSAAIALGHRAGDWAFLLPLAKTQSERFPEEAWSWLFLLKVLTKAAEPVEFQNVLRRLPSEVSGSVRNVAALGATEMRYGESERGLTRLYRLVRKNPENGEAMSAYLISYMTGKLPKREELSEAGAGRWVQFRDEDTSGSEILCIDPEGCGELPPREGYCAPDSEEAVMFIGARPGTTVSIPMTLGGARNVRVVAVGSVYERLAATAQERAGRLGGLPHIKSVPVGTSGDFEKDFRRMRDELRRSGEASRRALESYGRGEMTLSMLARALGKSVPEIVAGWPSDGPPLFVGDGLHAEREEALALLRKGETVFVADTSALTELARLDVVGSLGVLGTVLISTATKDVAESFTENAFDDDAFGTVFDDGGRLGYLEFDERHRKNRKDFATAVSDAVGKCVCVPAYGDLGGGEDAEALSRILSPEELESLLLAREKGAVLLTADGRLRFLAKHVFGVEGMWLQPLVMRAGETGALANRVVSSFAAREFLSNRNFVSLRAEDLLWMFCQGDIWLQTGVAKLKIYLAATSTDLVSSLDVVVRFLRSLPSVRVQVGAYAEIVKHLAEPFFRRDDSPVDLRNMLAELMEEVIEESSSQRHPILMLNLEIERQNASRLRLFLSAVDEAKERAKCEPIEAPVRVRILHCSKTPWLVVDKHSESGDMPLHVDRVAEHGQKLTSTGATK